MKKIIILFVIIFLIGFNPMQAQRPPCYTNYQSLTFEGKVPERFPLLKLDMPYETMLFYIWMHDWLYNYNVEDFLYYLNNKTFDDEYKKIVKNIYIAKDYNPVLFEEQINYEDTLMRFTPDLLMPLVTDRLREIMPEWVTYWALIKSGIIVRVKITDIVKRPMYSGTHALITSEIQDVIKGKIIPTCKDMSIPDSPEEYDRPDPSFQINKPGQCFQFVVGRDYQEVNLEVGNDYIFFIYFLENCTDTLNNIKYCYYSCNCTKKNLFLPKEKPEYYIFPVINNIVEDPNHLLNFGEGLTYNEWLNKLMEKIDDILQKNYTSVEDNLPNFNNNISVYPNPADSYLNIKLNGNIKYPVSVVIYNNLGVKVKSLENVTLNSRFTRIKIDNLNSGIYFLLLTDGNNSYSKSFYVIR